MCAQKTTLKLNTSKFLKKPIQGTMARQLKKAGVTLEAKQLSGGRSALEITSSGSRGIAKTKEVVNDLIESGRLGRNASVSSLRTKTVGKESIGAPTIGRNVWQPKPVEPAVKPGMQVVNKPATNPVDRLIGNVTERPAINTAPVIKPSAPNLRTGFAAGAISNPDFSRINEARKQSQQLGNSFAAPNKVPIVSSPVANPMPEVNPAELAPSVPQQEAQMPINNAVEPVLSASIASVDKNYPSQPINNVPVTPVTDTMTDQVSVVSVGEATAEVPVSEPSGEATSGADSATTAV